LDLADIVDRYMQLMQLIELLRGSHVQSSLQRRRRRCRGMAPPTTACRYKEPWKRDMKAYIRALVDDIRLDWPWAPKPCQDVYGT
jgi:hypothetical protein